MKRGARAAAGAFLVDQARQLDALEVCASPLELLRRGRRSGQAFCMLRPGHEGPHRAAWVESAGDERQSSYVDGEQLELEPSSDAGDVVQGIPCDPSSAIVVVDQVQRELALEHVLERQKFYAKANRAPTSLRRYAVDWKAFRAWAEPLELPTLPTSPGVVARFLAHLADLGRRPSSITVALAAIGHYHREAGFDWYAGHLEIARTMQGIRRTLGTAVVRKNAINGEQLQAMCELLEPDGRGLQHRAILCTAWSGRCAGSR